MTLKKKQILVAEDNSILAMELKDTLQSFGYRVPVTASTAEEAVGMAKKQKPALILMDINLKGGIDGIEVAGLIRDFLKVPIVFLSGYTDTRTRTKADRTHPFQFITKPFDVKELQSVLKNALKKSCRV